MSTGKLILGVITGVLLLIGVGRSPQAAGTGCMTHGELLGEIVSNYFLGQGVSADLCDALREGLREPNIKRFNQAHRQVCRSRRKFEKFTAPLEGLVGRLNITPQKYLLSRAAQSGSRSMRKEASTSRNATSSTLNSRTGRNPGTALWVAYCWNTWRGRTSIYARQGRSSSSHLALCRAGQCATTCGRYQVRLHLDLAFYVGRRRNSVTRAFISPQENRMCTVKVTNDYSIGIMGIDRYISNLTAEKLRSLLRIRTPDPDVHALSEYHFAGRKADHFIYSGFLQEGKLATASFQTIRGPYLYTLNCASPAEIFAQHYKQFTDIAASFRIE